jgi:hypothetical protein
MRNRMHPKHEALLRELQDFVQGLGVQDAQSEVRVPQHRAKRSAGSSGVAWLLGRSREVDAELLTQPLSAGNASVDEVAVEGAVEWVRVLQRGRRPLLVVPSPRTTRAPARGFLESQLVPPGEEVHLRVSPHSHADSSAFAVPPLLHAPSSGAARGADGAAEDAEALGFAITRDNEFELECFGAAHLFAQARLGTPHAFTPRRHADTPVSLEPRVAALRSALAALASAPAHAEERVLGVTTLEATLPTGKLRVVYGKGLIYHVLARGRLAAARRSSSRS